MGERGGKKIAQVDYDNSPLVFNSGQLHGKEVVLTSSNGTECILAAGSDSKAVVLIGALLNASSVAQFALETARTTGRGISILVAGRNNEAVTEDVIAASEIAFTLRGAPIHSDIDLIISEDFVVDFLNSASGRNLSALGRSEDVIFCARKDVFDIVPVFRDRVVVAASGKVVSS
jgi:2-phosphosulfolactate phosphatase